MEFLNQFIHIFLHYLQELWWILLIGFFLAGLIHEFIPTAMVERHLGNPGLRSIAIASITGIILPICCMGTLPVAVTLKRKGASLGSVLAFLVATPATSVSALVVTWKLLGWTFAVAISFAVVIMAFGIGIVADRIGVGVAEAGSAKAEKGCCEGCGDNALTNTRPAESVKTKIKDAFRYALIVMPRDIGGEILLAIAVASLILVANPVQHFIQNYLVGAVGYVFVLVFGLLDYACATASVPLAHALVRSGMTAGQALCYLIVGPITSYATLLVVRKEFGRRILWLYLAMISVMSLGAGIVYDIFIV